MESAGKVNAYQCEQCHYLHVAVLLTTGVTPFMVRCKSRRRDGTQCDGTATSQFYRVQQSWLRANDSLGMKRELQVHYAFYRPNNQISNLESVREHLLGGGLLFDTLAMALRLHDSSFVIASDFDVRNEQLRIEVLTALQRKYGPPIG